MKLTLKQIIEWHLENAKLSEINNEYDRGRYDCLKMVHKYVLEDECVHNRLISTSYNDDEKSGLPDRNRKVDMTEIRIENF